jgi:hypothetical protein
VLGLLIALVADWHTRELFLRWIITSPAGFLFAATVIVKNMEIARNKIASDLLFLVGVIRRYSNRPDLLEQLRKVAVILSDDR